MLKGVPAERIARFREMKFAADTRCSGWFTTNLQKYIGNEPVVPDDCLMLGTVRQCLKKNVFCRWRIYYHDMRFMQLSVREEDVERMYEAMKDTLKHTLPRSEHLTCLKIYWEHIPHYKDLFEITNTFLKENDARKILASPDGQTQNERVQYTKLVDTLDHIAKRFIGDFPERRVRDTLLKRVFLSNLSYLRPEITETKWLHYQNVWALSERIDEICPRTEKEAKVLSKYYPITKRQYQKFHTIHPEEVAESKKRPKPIDDSEMIVPNNTTDNDLLRNIDVVRGRGMYLSTTKTYELDKPEAVQSLRDVFFEAREGAPPF